MTLLTIDEAGGPRTSMMHGVLVATLARVALTMTQTVVGCVSVTQRTIETSSGIAMLACFDAGGRPQRTVETAIATCRRVAHITA